MPAVYLDIYTTDELGQMVGDYLKDRFEVREDSPAQRTWPGYDAVFLDFLLAAEPAARSAHVGIEPVWWRKVPTVRVVITPLPMPLNRPGTSIEIEKGPSMVDNMKEMATYVQEALDMRL